MFCFNESTYPCTYHRFTITTKVLMVRDYCDGTQYKSHSLFQTDPHALQIIIHYDDLEVCNPLGTKSSLHKVGT